jgi:hypothetical protein
MSISHADVRAPAFDELGPIEYLIVEFGSGQVPGAAFREPERDTATLLAQLTELGQLRDAGVLSEAEFEVQKARILHR